MIDRAALAASAAALSRAGDHAALTALYRQALAYLPREPGLLVDLGRAEQSQEHFEEAERHYCTARARCGTGLE